MDSSQSSSTSLLSASSSSADSSSAGANSGVPSERNRVQQTRSRRIRVQWFSGNASGPEMKIMLSPRRELDFDSFQSL